MALRGLGFCSLIPANSQPGAKTLRHWTKAAATLGLGLGLVALFFYSYSARLVFNYTLDGLAYASHVEKTNPMPWVYFHPHHLLYGLLGRIFYLGGQELGALWDGLVALQFFGIVTGALGGFILFHILVRETGNRVVAFCAGVGLASSHSYWYFSIIPGVRIWAMVTPLLAWYALTFLKRRPPAFGLLAGLVFAWAILGHQTNVLLVPAMLGGIFMLRDRSLRDRLKTAAYYLFAATTATLAIYLLVGSFAYHTDDFKSWIAWVTEYMHAKQKWGGYLKASGIQRGGSAMVQAFLPTAESGNMLAGQLSIGAARTLLVWGLYVLLGSLLLNIKRIWVQNRQALWVALAWLLAFVPFFVWWEPWNIEFWVTSTVPCWVLLGLAADKLEWRWKNPVLRFSQATLMRAAFASLVLIFYLYNLDGGKNRPPTRRYEFKTLLSALDFNMKPDDLLLISGINNVHYYIDRFGARRYISLTRFLRRALRSGGAVAAFAKLDEAVQAEWAAGHQVFVLTEAIDNFADARAQTEGMLGLARGSLSEYFKKYKRRKVSYMGRAYFYELSKAESHPPRSDP